MTQDVDKLIAELRAKAWQSSTRRNSAGGLSKHRDHVCWRAANTIERLVWERDEAIHSRDWLSRCAQTEKDRGGAAGAARADFEAHLKGMKAERDHALAALAELRGEVVEVVWPFAEAASHLHPSQPDDGLTLDGIEVRAWRHAAALASRLKEGKVDG